MIDRWCHVTNKMRSLKDEWGGIDKNIFNLVITLNVLYVPTTGSCEGHIDHGAPAPWVKVTAAGEPNTKKNSETYRKWQQKNLQLRKKTNDFLEMFYQNRNVRNNVRIIIEKGYVGFWIHNGGIAYKKWRNEMMSRVVMREKGKYVSNASVSMRGKIKRAKTLPLYQKEMKLFARFVKKKARALT